MKFTTIFLTIFMLFSMDQAFARQQKATRDFPNSGLISATANARLQQKLNALMRGTNHPTGVMLKTTSGNERLVAETDYDYTKPVGTQFVDSLRVIYSGTRSSQFDFAYLGYDFNNNIDFPTSYSMGSYLSFDTVRTYDSPGTGSFMSTGFRKYNASGKVTFNGNLDYRTYFDYDATNHLLRSTNLNYNTGSMTWDSGTRDFYFYNGFGFLVRDSTEQFDGSNWMPSFVGVFTNNSAGYPTQVNYDVPIGAGVSVTIAQANLTYGSSSSLFIRSIFKFINNAGTALINQSKDTFAYTGNMQVYHNGFSWDTLTNAWSLSGAERRHLNAASLPDSAWSLAINSGGADTTILKLAYNTQGNPIYARLFTGSAATPDNEARYYYSPTNVSVGGIAVAKNLAVYPNPANDLLHFSGVLNGRFNILNAAGQLVSDGVLKASSSIPVKMLPPGVYTLRIQDSKGEVYLAKFIRQ